MKFVLRPATQTDLPSILALFEETIETVGAKDYTREQRNAWAAGVKNIERWEHRIKNQYFLVAEYNGHLVGFGSLKSDDHIDLLYTHKDFQRKGIAAKLLAALENRALKNHTQLLTANVSKTARVFFERNGFYIKREQTFKTDSVEISNYSMEKKL